MDWLNYHHLYYFWVVARAGSITAACDELQLSQPTISSQLRRLERSLGAKLLVRRGRGLTLTETGRMVLDYADEIFTLGRELADVLAGRPSDRPVRFAVGVPDVFPKLITYRILEPVLALPERVQMICREGKLGELLNDLASHRLDLVVADSPVGPSTSIRVFNHLLGECSVSVFGTADFARRYGRRFPQSLDGAPMILPTRNTGLRRLLDQWFEAQGLRPAVAGEFEDSALLKTFGQSGMGLFFGPSAIEGEICRQYSVRALGRVEAVKERFYAVTPERRVKHPAVVEITKEAREALFK